MAVSLNDALIKVLENINCTKYEIIPIENAVSRISAEKIVADISLPKFNNSAMDGYAILFEDKDKELEVTDKIFAGDNNNRDLKSGTTIKVMTGARVPSNCEAVVAQEDVKINGNKIKIDFDVKKEQHIRFVGEDVLAGDTVLEIGDEINFSKITLLASQGVSHIKVFRKPKVVVFASGEELKLHYQKAEEYQIFNSNTPTFIARAKELGCEVRFIGQAHDTIESLKEHIKNSLDSDLIVTSGGVSVGEADFTKESFAHMGIETIFDGIIIKPGKPTVFGKIEKTFVLNLPGNPLASALIFEIVGKIIIQKLLGANKIYHGYIKTKLGAKLSNKKGRLTLLPGDFDGEAFYPSIKRSPGMVSILSNCNSLVCLDENISCLEKDSDVKIMPINWKFFEKEYKDFITYE